MSDGDVRRYAPATLRNREVITAVLADALPASGLVLEIASGSGEHVAYFARALPGRDWQPRGRLAGAARSLPAGAPLILYGPYRREGGATAPSNEAFDQSLRARDPRWGLRSVEAVRDAARGFVFDRLVEMPANNLMLVFRRA